MFDPTFTSSLSILDNSSPNLLPEVGVVLASQGHELTQSRPANFYRAPDNAFESLKSPASPAGSSNLVQPHREPAAEIPTVTPAQGSGVTAPLSAALFALGVAVNAAGGAALVYRASNEQQREKSFYLRAWDKLLSISDRVRDYVLHCDFAPAAVTANRIFLANTATMLGLVALSAVSAANTMGIGAAFANYAATLSMLAIYTLNNILTVKAAKESGTHQPMNTTAVTCMIGSGLGIASLIVSTLKAATLDARAAEPYIIAGLISTAAVRTLGIWSLLSHVENQLSRRSQDNPGIEPKLDQQHLNIPPSQAYHLFTAGSLLICLASPWTLRSGVLPLVVFAQNCVTSYFLARAQAREQQLLKNAN